MKLNNHLLDIISILQDILYVTSKHMVDVFHSKVHVLERCLLYGCLLWLKAIGISNLNMSLFIF